MATYKVPQDVEAEDKLLGPFTLKQFIFILLFFASGWIGFLFSQITPPLALVVVPFLIAFGTLGFVQRKDQPVEIYLAALIRFYLKPHRRIWDQEGYDQRVTITAPKVVEIQRARSITQSEVTSQLSSLAQLMDSRGWAAKGINTTPSDRLVTLQSATAGEEAPDMMDEQADVAQKFKGLLEQQQVQKREQMVERMQHPEEAPQVAAQPVVSGTPAIAAPSSAEPEPNLRYNPYPNKMHQHVVLPMSEQQRLAEQQKPVENPQNPPQQPVTPPVSPDTIRLAYNGDLTVSAIAREAHEISPDEVVISLH